MDNLFAESEFVDVLLKRIAVRSNATIVSPDAGGTKALFLPAQPKEKQKLISLFPSSSFSPKGVLRARRIADQLHVDNVATILKRRAQANVIEAMQIVGNVSGKLCVIVDDIIDTAGNFYSHRLFLCSRERERERDCLPCCHVFLRLDLALVL